jgi:hypothetical protein
VSTLRFPTPQEHEPAVFDPRLKALVDMARAQPLPPLRVRAEDLHDAWAQHRRGRWRKALIGAAAVLVGVSLAGVLPRLVDDAQPGVVAHSSRAHAVTPTRSATHDDAIGSEAAPVPSNAAQSTEPQDGTALPGEGPRLAAGVRFEPIDPTRAQFEVVGTWAVTVAAGVYRVEVPVEAGRGVQITVDERILLVEPGATVELDADHEPRVTVVRGQANWIEQGPQRTRPGDRSSASDLGRRAEARMTAGDRDGAIAALTELVRTYPQSAAARAGLLDLARLFRVAKRSDEARCAYGMYLRRWPGSRVQGEVERALAQLGEGPRCRGLRPVR